MKSFFELSLMLEADPMPNISSPMGMGGPPPGGPAGAPPGAPPMGGGMPPMGGGAPPMGGGMPPMGGPPMGGGAPATPTPALKLKATNVWEALDKYFSGDKQAAPQPAAQQAPPQVPQAAPQAPQQPQGQPAPDMGGGMPPQLPQM